MAPRILGRFQGLRRREFSEEETLGSGCGFRVFGGGFKDGFSVESEGRDHWMLVEFWGSILGGLSKCSRLGLAVKSREEKIWFFWVDFRGNWGSSRTRDRTEVGGLSGMLLGCFSSLLLLLPLWLY